MAISRAQLLKELLPGLNALFGLEYARYGEQHKEIYEIESSERSFEEETKLSGFAAAAVKNETLCNGLPPCTVCCRQRLLCQAGAASAALSAS